MVTLENILVSQDMGEKHIIRLCAAVKDATFDANNDPITAIIVNALGANEEQNGAVTDLKYAIRQLTRAITTIEAEPEITIS